MLASLKTPSKYLLAGVLTSAALILAMVAPAY